MSAPINTSPKASDKSVTTSFNSPVDIALEATDENVNDELKATIVTQPEHGTARENRSGYWYGELYSKPRLWRNW